MIEQCEVMIAQEIHSLNYYKIVTDSEEINLVKELDNAQDRIRLEFIKIKIDYLKNKMNILNDQLDVVKNKFDVLRKYIDVMDRSNNQFVEFFYESLFLEKKSFEDVTKEYQDCQKELTQYELYLKDKSEWLSLKEKWND